MHATDTKDARPEISLKACLMKFRSSILLVASTCLGSGDAHVFSASKAPCPRLRSMGFTNYVPCFNGTVFYSPLVMQELTERLLDLKTRSTKFSRASLADGSFRVTPGRLSLRGCPAWRKTRPHDATFICIPSGQDIYAPPQDAHCNDSRPVSFSISCPHCDSGKSVSNITLFRKGKWTTLQCSLCASASSSRKWKCVCGAPWSGCAIHACVGFACRSRVRSHRVQTPAVPVVEFTNHLLPPTGSQGRNSHSKARRRITQHVTTQSQPCNSVAVDTQSHSRKQAVVPPLSGGFRRPGIGDRKRKATDLDSRHSSSMAPRRSAKSAAKRKALEALAAARRLRSARMSPIEVP